MIIIEIVVSPVCGCVCACMCVCLFVCGCGSVCFYVLVFLRFGVFVYCRRRGCPGELITDNALLIKVLP